MSNLMKTLLAAAAGLALSQAAPASALAAGGACPPGVPQGIFCGEKDASLAPAGTYAMDTQHAAVVARVAHMGYSISVFRFDKAKATLTWDPAAPAKSSVTASVETASITSNVPGFATEIADKYLMSKANPTASFTSTAFRRTDATHGQVEGRLTLMGKTAPLTFDVVLVGAGKGFGAPRIGMTARGWIKPGDYGMPAVFADPIELVIDAEFEKQG
ncbi:YceI family protein [Phenylobacterium sp.]|uniref:YceI family protein n=1 Tax=Phenylobacterium sp. TaxID=1871053 RepID=UPI003BAAB502